MPTERLNISLVDPECIKEIKELRKYLEEYCDDRISIPDVIKALLATRVNVDKLAANLH